MNKNLIMVIILIAGLGLGFLGGMVYQKSQAGNQRLAANGQFRGRFGQNGNGNNNGQRPVIGSIISQDQNSITVKLPDGSSKIVLLSGSTMVNKTEPGTTSDLKSGDMVLVTGSTNSDGSVSAQSVMINPMVRNGGPRPQPSTSPQAQQSGY